MSERYLASDKEMLLNGIGTELCWGWSPAVDMLRFLADPVVESPPAATSSVNDIDEDDVSSSKKAANEAAKKKETSQQVPKKPKKSRSEELLDMLMDETEADKQAKEAAPPAADEGTADEDGDDEVFEEVNVLLAGACDFRHIVLTMSKMRAKAIQRGVQQRVHFYLYEPNLRVHCRHVFFLQLLHDSMFALSELEDRVAMLLELYGNTNLRDITAAQLKATAQKCIRSIGYEEGEFAKFLDFSEMKSKERDFVEEQIRHWTTDTSRCFMEEIWNGRLRREMAERYDNKDNIIDWDFNFKLFEYTNAVKFPEYRDWRNTGTAYDYCHINPRKGFQYDYTVPNKTLCQFDRRGNGTYFGDIKNGPFSGIGIDTENKQLHKRSPDGALKFGNGVIAMHNIRAWIYELLTAKPWPWADHVFAWDDPKNYNYLPPDTPSDVEYKASMPDVRFHFLGLEMERFYVRNKEKADGPIKFDAAFVGSNCTQFMTKEFFASMDDEGVVVTENIKFVVDAEEEAKMAFNDKIRGMADASGWEHAPRDTAKLHECQPPPRKYETEPSEAQKKTMQRLQMPYQLVLRKKKPAKK